jgi:hypothetical protein
LEPEALPPFLTFLPFLRKLIIFLKSFMVVWSVVPASLSPPGDCRVGALVKILAVDFFVADFLPPGVNLEILSTIPATLPTFVFFYDFDPLLAPPTTLALPEDPEPA